MVSLELSVLLGVLVLQYVPSVAVITVTNLELLYPAVLSMHSFCFDSTQIPPLSEVNLIKEMNEKQDR